MCKWVVVCCSSCGRVVDFVGVFGSDGGGGLVFVEGDGVDYAGW